LKQFRPIPAVAIIPIALLIFGFGYRMEFSIVAFAVFWTTIILARAAVASIDPRLAEVAALLGLSISARLSKIYLPASLPRLFVALRLSVGISLVVAVTVEIASNTLGLGYRMMEAQSSLHPDLSLAYLVWIGILGWAVNVGLARVQLLVFARMGTTPGHP
jgi:sulfonate transport system permease protein